MRGTLYVYFPCDLQTNTCVKRRFVLISVILRIQQKHVTVPKECLLILQIWQLVMVSFLYLFFKLFEKFINNHYLEVVIYTIGVEK